MPRKRKLRRKSKINWSKIRWGSLTAWLKRNQAWIKRKYGNPFTKSGEINDRTLWKMYRDENFKKKHKKIWRKIHFKLHVLKG